MSPAREVGRAVRALMLLAALPASAAGLPAQAALPPVPRHPDSPLVTRHEVVGLPSASVGAFLRRTQGSRPKPPGTLALFADPVFSPDDERVGARSRATAKAAAPAHGAPAGAAATRDFLAHALRDAGLEGLPRLPFTRREARNIAALVPFRERLEALDFDANLEAARSPRLSDFRLLQGQPRWRSPFYWAGFQVQGEWR